MESAGLKLKHTRERLKLRYREVAEASQKLAQLHGNPEYAIALSRLSEIENKDAVPTIFRLYSLCAIYRLDLAQVLSWYGVHTASLTGESARLPLAATHIVHTAADLPPAEGQSVIESSPERTAFVGHVHRLGRISAALLPGLESRHHRFGYIGTEDWSMHPVLHPGSLVIIDERHKKITNGGWADESDRPIYFFESRQGYCCGWAWMLDDVLVVQPHPASQRPPSLFRYPNEVEILGRVVGAAMFLSSRKRSPDRTEATRAASPNQ